MDKFIFKYNKNYDLINYIHKIHVLRLGKNESNDKDPYQSNNNIIIIGSKYRSY